MLVIASRGSQLALWQAHWVQGQLAAAGPKAASRSSRPPATKSPMCRWPRWAPKGSSPRKSRRRCWMAAPTWPCTASKICPRSCPMAWCWPPCRGAKTRGTPSSGNRLAELPRRRARGHQLPAPQSPNCASYGPISSRIRARQRGYASAQAGRGPVRCHPAGGRRTQAAGMGRSHCRDFSARRDVPGGRPGRSGHRDAAEGRGLRRLRRAGPCGDAHGGDGRARLLAALGGGCQVPIGAHATRGGRPSAIDRHRGFARRQRDDSRTADGAAPMPKRSGAAWGKTLPRARAAADLGDGVGGEPSSRAERLRPP